LPVAPVATITPPPVVAPPAAAEESHHSVAPWVVTAAGGAILLTGGVVWLVGHGKYTTATTQCPTQMGCSPQATSDGNTGHTMMLAGGTMFIAGVAATAAGLIWHFAESTGPSGEKKAAVEPVFGPGYAGIAGRFW